MASSARIESDVIAVRPQLVIWQVGANAALHHDDSDVFETQVAAGVRRLEAAGIDVVLMDNQRAPRILASTDHDAIEVALAQAARGSGAGLFSRDRLMAGWETEGVAPAAFTAPDSLHHNDRGYLCVARSLARLVVHAITGTVSLASH